MSDGSDTPIPQQSPAPPKQRKRKKARRRRVASTTAADQAYKQTMQRIKNRFVLFKISLHWMGGIGLAFSAIGFPVWISAGKHTTIEYLTGWAMSVHAPTAVATALAVVLGAIARRALKRGDIADAQSKLARAHLEDMIQRHLPRR